MVAGGVVVLVWVQSVLVAAANKILVAVIFALITTPPTNVDTANILLVVVL